MAGQEGHNNIVTFLLSHGARVNDVDIVSNITIMCVLVDSNNNNCILIILTFIYNSDIYIT